MAVTQYREIPDIIPPMQFDEFQSSFIGGMNLLPDDTKINENEYREAFNLTNRFDILSPISDSVEIASVSNATFGEGNIQGAIAAGVYIVVFSQGQAYYRRFDGGNFNPIPNFSMNRGAPNIWSCAVPASYFNLNRSLLVQVDNSGNNINFNSQVQASFTGGLTSTSPACIVCQDGLTQPFIIFIDPVTGLPNSRPLQKYSDWMIELAETTNLREYVPIGKQMLYYDGILFIVSVDGLSIYRSVQGRPLDFVVAIDSNGNKLAQPFTLSPNGVTQILLEYATLTSYSIGFSQIVALYTASGYSGIIASTINNASIGILIDTTNTIFGEPTFDRDPLFGTGPLNMYSTCDILGDTAFIDGDGIKSFNASKQTRIETNNSIFSLKIASLFGESTSASLIINILQDATITACIVFNGYAFFSCNTIYGNVLIVFDTYNQCWVSIVQIPALNGAAIKQFVSLMPNAKKLYGITSDNRLFDLFSSATFLTASFNTAGFSYTDIAYEQQAQLFRCVLKNTTSTGMLTITPTCDLVVRDKVNKPLRAKPLNNVLVPFTTKPFNGWEISYNLSWTGGGTLINLMHKASVVGLDNPLSQASGANSK